MEFWSNISNEINCNTVLELASGTGRLTHVFLQRGVSYTGLEICSKFVYAAQKNLTPVVIIFLLSVVICVILI